VEFEIQIEKEERSLFMLIFVKYEEVCSPFYSMDSSIWCLD